MAVKKTPELCNEIIDRISNGEPLRQICRDEHMPNWQRVYEWMDDDKDFSGRIARARETGYEAIAQETLDIADDARNDWMDKATKDGTVRVIDAEHIQRSKLRIDTRLKLLSKWSPKKYGDRISTELSGPDGGPMESKTEVTINFVRPTPKP